MKGDSAGFTRMSDFRAQPAATLSPQPFQVLSTRMRDFRVQPAAMSSPQPFPVLSERRLCGLHKNERVQGLGSKDNEAFLQAPNV